jgi:phospholipid/cholesterol/gamma-HCH transport system substrate-binding protein
MSTEFKAGAFVLASLVALVFMTTQLTKTRYSSYGVKHYYSVVKDATGLLTKTKIKMAGLDVGKISNVELVGTQARLTLEVSSEITLHKDAKIYVRSIGFLGDKYIELNPGSENTEILAEGGMIEQGVTGGGIEELTAKTSEVMDNIKEVTALLKQALKGSDEEDDSRIDRILDNMENFTAGLSSIEKYGELADRLNEIAVNVADMTNKIKKGEGTLGKLLNDSETIDKVNSTLSAVNKLVTKADRMALLFDAHGGALTRTGGSKGYFSLTFQPSYDKYYILGINSGPRYRSKATRKVTTVNPDSAGSSTTTTLEVEEDPNSIFVNAQFGKRFSNFVARIGLFETSVGAGVDYYMNQDRVKLYTEAYRFGGGGGTNAPQLNVGLEYHFYKPFYVWTGGDDLISKYKNYFIGVGLRFSDNDLKTLVTMAAQSGAARQ